MGSFLSEEEGKGSGMSLMWEGQVKAADGSKVTRDCSSVHGTSICGTFYSRPRTKGQQKLEAHLPGDQGVPKQLSRASG